MGRRSSIGSEKRHAYSLSVAKPERKRSLGRRIYKSVIKIEKAFKEIGWGGTDWIDLGQDRDQWRALVSAVLNLRAPQNARKVLSRCTTGDLSGRAQLH
jgi:hypothetical protein